jgi:hypothetical protein
MSIFVSRIFPPLLPIFAVCFKFLPPAAEIHLTLKSGNGTVVSGEICIYRNTPGKERIMKFPKIDLHLHLDGSNY